MVNAIHQHKSIRKFKNKTIDADILKEILLAASRASTTGNMQVYSMVVSSEPTIKNKLCKAHFSQQMVNEAPLVITFCADFNRFNKWCEQRKATPGYDNFLSFVTAAIDALLAAQNLCIEAESHKLGICYLGTTTYMAESIIEILKLPKYVVPITTVVVGHPDEAPELTDRLPLEAIVHEEVYSDYSKKEIDMYYAEKESLELTSKLLKENNKDTLAQIFTENRYTKKDNIAFSQALLNVLKKQGFMENGE